ncbi:MAG: hypothetical protein JRJ03_18440 [Deltaproteobacteria bacterium]|nr:hypothetical protein [Deltaproteobacteria bacterium]
MTAVDDAIEEHVRAKVQEAYPDLEEDQVIVKFPEARANFTRPHNMRDNSGKWAVCEETVTCMVAIASEDKLNRATLIRKLPRKTYQLGGYKVLQEYQRAVNADLVEVINMKGLVFYISYTYVVYSE